MEARFLKNVWDGMREDGIMLISHGIPLRKSFGKLLYIRRFMPGTWWNHASSKSLGPWEFIELPTEVLGGKYEGRWDYVYRHSGDSLRKNRGKMAGK